MNKQDFHYMVGKRAYKIVNDIYNEQTLTNHPVLDPAAEMGNNVCGQVWIQVSNQIFSSLRDNT